MDNKIVKNMRDTIKSNYIDMSFFDYLKNSRYLPIKFKLNNYNEVYK